MRAQVVVLSKQQGAGKSPEEPGEPARRGSGLDEGCKMEFDEETDCKKKLEEQKKGLQLRAWTRFSGTDNRRFGKKSWREEKNRASARAAGDAEEVTKAAELAG